MSWEERIKYITGRVTELDKEEDKRKADAREEARVLRNQRARERRAAKKAANELATAAGQEPTPSQADTEAGVTVFRRDSRVQLEVVVVRDK
ncbi:hypothetical protein ANO14919_024140 [Xylariales sp. No.14919]|nr:hypothetical protein ANO14919_024140 [Xylariales sp. No.14919]